MLAFVHVAQLKVTQANLAQRKFPKEIISAVLDKDTGLLMEYQNLMKNPKYRPLYHNPYAKEIRGLSQVILGFV